MSDDEIRELVRDATRAPSSFNIQHWRFVAVRKPEDKERLCRAAYDQKQVEDAAVTFIVLGDTRGVDKLPGGTLGVGRYRFEVAVAGGKSDVALGLRPFSIDEPPADDATGQEGSEEPLTRVQNWPADLAR